MTQENYSPYQSRNRHHWQAHVKALHRSGLNRAEYCRQHKLSYHALTYWCKKGVASKCSSSPANLIPVPLPLSEVLRPKDDTLASLRLCLQGGITIEVGDQFSADTLLRLLSVVEQRT